MNIRIQHGVLALSTDDDVEPFTLDGLHQLVQLSDCCLLRRGISSESNHWHHRSSFAVRVVEQMGRKLCAYISQPIPRSVVGSIHLEVELKVVASGRFVWNLVAG